MVSKMQMSVLPIVSEQKEWVYGAKELCHMMEYEKLPGVLNNYKIHVLEVGQLHPLG